MSLDLINACENGNISLDIQDENGRTALIDACRTNNTEIAKILIENKANLDIQDKYGWTALMYACCDNNDTEIVSYMLEYMS